MKFGISFTTTYLNQAGALVQLYTDGTVLVHHGGVEMGQGLHTKIQGIAAAELGIDPVACACECDEHGVCPEHIRNCRVVRG